MQQERASYHQEGLRNSESSKERDRERSLDNKMSKCWDGPRRHDSSKDNKGEGHKSGESFSEDWVTLDLYYKYRKGSDDLRNYCS